MTGFLLINKPAGITSHDVIDQVRRITNERKVGHAGTLDPFATGLLIVAVGRGATQELNKYVGLDKEYEAVFILGARSETDDPEGPIVENPDARECTRQEIENAIQKFVGQIEQIPPKYAAIKVKGKKLYEAARAGEKIERKPRSVKIDQYELLEILPENLIKVRVKCGSGTYIRALARDLGEELGVGAYVEKLHRTQIGQHRIEQATTLDQITSENIKELLQEKL